jgi:flagellar FliL protein
MPPPAKTEAKENPPVPAEKAAPEKSGGDKSAAPGASGSAARPGPFDIKAWIPAIAAILLAPAASWAVAQYALLPGLQRKLAQPVSDEAPAVAPAAAKSEKGAAPVAPPSYVFDNIVVNLAGTMGTRYLKTTFQVTGSDPNLKETFEEYKARLTDVTLNVLSSLTLADLEEPGSKNVLREKLVTSYNQAIGRKVAEQVYFSDFVVQ